MNDLNMILNVGLQSCKYCSSSPAGPVGPTFSLLLAAVTLFATFFQPRSDLLPSFASEAKVESFCACTAEGLPL